MSCTSKLGLILHEASSSMVLLVWEKLCLQSLLPITQLLPSLGLLGWSSFRSIWVRVPEWSGICSALQRRMHLLLFSLTSWMLLLLQGLVPKLELIGKFNGFL